MSRRPAVMIALVLTFAATRAQADRFDAEVDAEPRPAPARLLGPPIAEVIAAAERAAGLNRDLARSFVWRARTAGLVPWLTVRAGRDTSWTEDEPDIRRGLALEVRATWRLDRLVFDGRELQVASVEAARRRERRRLASRVIRYYFAWRRAAGRSATCDPDDEACPGRAVAADEAAAELDALTDGWFSEELATRQSPARRFSGDGPRRTASENRTR